MLRVTSFSHDQSNLWDGLVGIARNGVFLFERPYMDYHAARFIDASLMIWRDDHLIGLLPAHRLGTAVVSHGGLTFGGLVVHPTTGAQAMIEIIDAVIMHLRQQGALRLIYKPAPHIYHRQPSEDDVYALYRMGASISRMDLSMTIDLTRRPSLAKGRRHAISKARRANIEVRESRDFFGFWSLLSETLESRHGVTPVHTLDEIELLSSRFSQIALHTAHAGDAMLAGVVTYRYDHVLHTQYMASTPTGRECGALDLILVHLIEEATASQIRWFNFGASTFDQGRQLNTGLAAQKEMFGGRGTLIQTFELDLS
jgi:Acetyltransferase (GNAT) domain